MVIGKNRPAPGGCGLETTEQEALLPINNIAPLSTSVNYLEIYEQYGFKFFPCKIDKSPDTPIMARREKPYRPGTSRNVAKNRAYDRRLDTDDVVVLDLDRHEGSRME
jgi:hypothetical protein